MLPQEVRTEEAYHSLRRRQIFIWVFLVLLTVSIVGGIFSVAYQVIKSGGNQNRSIANTPVIRPVVGGSDVSENKKEESKDYFIFGELASSDKKYRLYKIRTQPFSKEEIFSFPWSDPKTLPEVTVQGGLIGVFFEPGKGLLLHPDGKVVGTSELAFQPPYAYFSISPDGTRMIYFKYFSSIGTTSLTVRDVKTNEDVFGWPIGSEASRPCEFIGWSQDGRKAYCVAMVKSRADVKSFDVKSFSYAVAGSAPEASAARFDAERSLLVSAGKSGISALDVVGKTRRTITDLSSGAAQIENLFLNWQNAARVLFTRGDSVYSVPFSGGASEKIIPDARLVAVSPDGTLILLEGLADDGNPRTRRAEQSSYDGTVRYWVASPDGSHKKELFTVSHDIARAAYIGWFSE